MASDMLLEVEKREATLIMEDGTEVQCTVFPNEKDHWWYSIKSPLGFFFAKKERFKIIEFEKL